MSNTSSYISTHEYITKFQNQFPYSDDGYVVGGYMRGTLEAFQYFRIKVYLHTNSLLTNLYLWLYFKIDYKLCMLTRGIKIKHTLYIIWFEHNHYQKHEIYMFRIVIVFLQIDMSMGYLCCQLLKPLVDNYHYNMYKMYQLRGGFGQRVLLICGPHVHFNIF